MVEPIMYFAIGFLVAVLFALMFLPLVHNRAVRLTMRRLEAATPLTIAEIRADKDQLRAEFAMSTRRLELSVEQMRVTTTAQLADLGKKTDAINQLKKELGEKSAAVLALEARDKSLVDQLRASEQEFQLKSSALREAERALADKEAELSKLLAELGDQSIIADGQRLELAALRTQIEAMKVGIAEYEQTMKASAERLDRERSEAAAGAGELTTARTQLEALSDRASELERQVVSQTVEAELLNKRLQELETRLGDQGRLLVERDYEIERLRGEVEAALASGSDAPGKSADGGQRTGRAAQRYKSVIAKLETVIAGANEERTRLLGEIADLKRAAESSWAAERVESALLRERINDVAAEVAHLTATLEGPGSPIGALLSGAHDATDSNGHANGGPVNGTLARGEAGPAQIASTAGQKNTLADRIRALQATAARAASANSTQRS